MRQRAGPHSPRLTCHCRRRRLTRGHATPVERAESTRRLGSLHPLGVEPRHTRGNARCTADVLEDHGGAAALKGSAAGGRGGVDSTVLAHAPRHVGRSGGGLDGGASRPSRFLSRIHQGLAHPGVRSHSRQRAGRPYSSPTSRIDSIISATESGGRQLSLSPRYSMCWCRGTPTPFAASSGLDPVRRTGCFS